jgi:hypothetical protein
MLLVQCSGAQCNTKLAVYMDMCIDLLLGSLVAGTKASLCFTLQAWTVFQKGQKKLKTCDLWPSEIRIRIREKKGKKRKG